MADERFFPLAGPFTLEKLADIAEAEIGGSVPSSSSDEKHYCDVAPLSEATSEHVSFLDNKKYVDAYTTSKTGVCLVHPDLADRAPDGMALLITKQPYHGYARIADAFHPFLKNNAVIHEKSIIADTAMLGTYVSIGALSVISDDVKVGNGSSIGTNCSISKGVTIGENCIIGNNINLQCCDIGNNVILHPGVTIGQDGFGFALGAVHLKVPQLGKVIIGNDVEIGANSTIDRGTGPDTIIGDGCKIDNLVQIAHNVQLGMGCVIAAQTGISGSTKLGNYVIIGGQTGIAGHLEIGDGVQMAGKSGVTRSIPAGEKVGGSPAQPLKKWLRGVATLHKLSNSKKG